MPQRKPALLGAVAAFALAALAFTAVALQAGSNSGAGPVSPRAAAVAWRGLVDEPRVPVAVGERMLVVLDLPSLADRVAASGGRAGDRQERRWTASALSLQRLFLSRLTVQGAQIKPEFRYGRVLNGFSAQLDPRSLALLERAPEVEGIYPVRAAYPASVEEDRAARAAFSAGIGARPEGGLPGFDGRGVAIALLDTGVDRLHPYLRGRLLEGIDVVGGSELAAAASRPEDPTQVERHGTQLAGVMVGAGGPPGLAGIATGASVIPIRIAGWQRDAQGGWAVYSRTDQIIAGLERAVDPNDDGDAHDAARIALVGVAEPYAAFAQGALAQAAGGALRLDTLVVGPAGNDGPAGPGFGSVSGPGGAPAALTVAAGDLRPSFQIARVVLRAGLRVVLDRTLPLAGAVGPERPLDLPIATPRLSGERVLPAPGTPSVSAADFFDARGYSRVAARAALVPAGDDVARVAETAARAGAAAVLVYGARVPSGALGLDPRIPVPVVAVSTVAARALIAAQGAGASVGVSIGVPSVAVSGSGARVAPFSSRGLAFDGRVKPELVAPGVGLGTSDPGTNEDGSPRYGTLNGSSGAAAVVAAAGSVLAQARPELGAAELKSVLVGSARPLPATPLSAGGAGLVDLGAAAAAELAAEPATLALGRATTPGWRKLRRIRVTNLGTRTLRLTVAVSRRGFAATDAFFSARPRRLALRPGRTAVVRLTVAVPRPAPSGPAAEGVVVVRPPAGAALRVPFAIAFGPPRQELLPEAELSQETFSPADAVPTVLTLRAGFVERVGGLDQIEPVERLDIELFTGDGKRIGVVARVRNLLPGRFAFGITGRDPGGQRLKPGPYSLRLVAVPAGGGPASTRLLPFTIR